jgi:hypothetical protein
MRYLRTYEEKNNKPKVGDYVICDEGIHIDIHLDNLYDEFIKNNIGKCVNIVLNDIDLGGNSDDNDEYLYIINYDNIPKEIERYFCFDKHTGYADEDCKFTGFRSMLSNEIIYFSNNKDEMEVKISANKYNL